MVYLLHFDRPYKGARHFFVATDSDVAASSFDELGIPPSSHGLLRAAADAGITFTIARRWPGSAQALIRLKKQKQPFRFCATCASVSRERVS